MLRLTSTYQFALLTSLLWVLRAGYAVLMPGVSPADPNQVLKTCQDKYVIPQTLSTLGKYWGHISQWCLTYNDVLPCVNQALPSHSFVSDWFLYLVFDQSIARRMSKSICDRYSGLGDLVCMDNDINAVSECVNMVTKNTIKVFSTKLSKDKGTLRNSKKATTYACLIANGTAGCFKQRSGLRSCSGEKGQILYDFYSLLNGRCTTVDYGVQEGSTTTEQVVDSSPPTTSTTSQTGSTVRPSTPQLRRLRPPTGNSIPRPGPSSTQSEAKGSGATMTTYGTPVYLMAMVLHFMAV